MKIPMHLKPDDYSPQACQKRIRLWMLMATRNPNGFRKQSAKKSAKPNGMTLRLNALGAIARYGT